MTALKGLLEGILGAWNTGLKPFKFDQQSTSETVLVERPKKADSVGDVVENGLENSTCNIPDDCEVGHGGRGQEADVSSTMER